MKKVLALLLLVTMLASLGVSAFAETYVENYFTTPAGYMTKDDAKTIAKIVHTDEGAVNDDVFAYFDKLSDAFDNVAYVQQHDRIFLYQSDSTNLKFPLFELGQDFYMVIERGSDVEYTGEVGAQDYFVVAAIEDTADEIDLDPKLYDVTHYIVVAYAPPTGEAQIVTLEEPKKADTKKTDNTVLPTSKPSDKPVPSDAPVPSATPAPSVETKPAYTGQVTVGKTYTLFPGKNVTIRWMLPTGPNEDGSYDMPGLQVSYSDWNDDVNVVVGNPEVANPKPVEPGISTGVQSGSTDVSVDIGTSEVPVEQQPSTVDVGVDSGDKVDVTVGGGESAVDVGVESGGEETEVTVGGEDAPFQYSTGNDTADMVLGIIGGIFQSFLGN